MNVNRSTSKVTSRVIIDGRVLGAASGGFGTYVENLVLGLLRSQRDYQLEVWIHPQHRERVHQKILKDLKEMKTVISGSGISLEEELDRIWVPVTVPFLSLKELVWIPYALKKSKADLYLSPTFSSALAFLMPIPWFVTVHDLNHLQFGRWPKRLYYRWILKPFVLSAARAFTVSEVSRNELMKWLGGRKPIELAPNVVRANTQGCEGSLARGEKGNYFLTLSSLKAHKNLNRLFKAFRLYRQQGGSLDWVVSVSEGEAAKAWGAEREGVQAVGYLDEAKKDALLNGARALIFPSSYEGFGLPPVEAAIRGVPLVCSDIPAHREALLGSRFSAVKWVRSEDVSGWAQAMKEVENGRIEPLSEGNQEILKSTWSLEKLGRIMHDAIMNVVTEAK